MKNKKLLIKIIIIALITLTFSFALTSCVKDENERQYVDILVKHPLTGEIIKDYGWMEFPYDENFVMPEVSLKLKDKNVYLSDKDFDNGNWESHMQLYIDEDGTYMEQRSWKNDWPKEIGHYEIQVKFNEDGWAGEDSKNDKKYYRSVIFFTLKITE